MSRKQQALAAFNLGVPDEIPLWELHFHMWDKYSGEKTCFGGDFLALPEAKRDDALKRNAEIMVSVGEKLGFGAVSIPDMPWDCPYILPERDRLKLVRMLRSLDPDFLVGGGCTGSLCVPESHEYVEFSLLMYDDPEAVDRRAADILERGLRQLESLAEAGADFVYNPMDIADSRAPYFNDEQLERFLLPYTKQMSQAVRDAGLIPVMHTDGNIMPVLDFILDSGVSALQALDPIAGVSVAAVRERVGGRLCLCGNVDCGVMLNGTPDEVYALTSDIIAQGKGSPFILGGSNAVVYQTKTENYNAFLSAWKDNR